MSNDDYQVHDIYKYSRKTYKKHGVNIPSNSENQRENDCMIDSPRIITIGPEAARCSSCDDSEGEIANILHKKCHVIALAQQQLQKLLDETDKLLFDNTQSCRSIYDFVCIFREALQQHNRCLCFLLTLVVVSFFLGILLGAASCGTYLRKFNSPIFSCIDNYFSYDKYNRDDVNRAVV